MNKIINDLEGYINKNYPKYLEENPYEEFNKFLKIADEMDINYEKILEHFFNIVDNRILNRNKIIETYGGVYNFDNNFSGVIELRNIYSQYYNKNYLNNVKFDQEYQNKLYYLVFILETILYSSYPIIVINSVEKYMNLIKFYDENKSEGFVYYFRGQSDAIWKITPTCFRDINQNKTFIYSLKTLLNYYRKVNVLELYARKIDSEYKNSEMISFFQHSINYSPLIDFTESIITATFFALKRCEKQEFSKKDSALFILMDSKDQFRIKNLDEIDFDKLKIGVYKSGKKNAEDYLKIYQSMKRLTGSGAETKILLKKTNDRMKYQSGLFVLFNDYIIINPKREVVFNKNNPDMITKVVISKNIKNELLETIEKEYPDFKYEYLLNPYRRFQEMHDLNKN